MSYFLDTDICIFALKNTFPSIKERIKSLSPEKIKIPSVVKSELLLGALKTQNPKRVLFILEQFLDPFEVIPFSDDCTETYASIRCVLENKGQMIGPNDLIIAATVFANHGTLVTHNVKEFSRISSLKIEDWTK